MVHINLPPQPQPVAVVEAAVDQAQRDLSQRDLGQTDLAPRQSLTQFVDSTSENTSSKVRLSLLVEGLEHQSIGPENSLKSQPRQALSPEGMSLASLAQNATDELPIVEPGLIDTEPETVPEETVPEETVPEEIAPEEIAPEGSTELETPPEEGTSPEVILETDDPAAGEPLSDQEFISQLSLKADFQEYNPQTQVITAQGDVRLETGNSVIEADQIWVNLTNRFALAEGNVLLSAGAQRARGSRAEYNFIQQAGVINDVVGTLYLPDIDEDFASPLAGGGRSRRAFDPIDREPALEVFNDGNVQIGSSPGSQLSSSARIDDIDGNGQLNQLRFETEELSFGVEGWRTRSLRITNDPFSPPEIELRVDGLLLRNLSATQDELLLKRPRLVFDQGFSLPLLRSRILISRGGGVNPDDLNPVPVLVSVDGRDRGGLFIGRQIPIVTNDTTQLSITPQYFAAQALSGDTDSPIDLRNFGATAKLGTRFSPTTTLSGRAEITGFGFQNITEDTRARLSLNQAIAKHRLSLQYSYRDRLFNGSLGFQDVQSSLGAVLLSPNFRLGKTGVDLSYQASAQLINAATDRTDLLLSSGSDTDRVTLGRYQGSVAFGRSFNLWSGQPRPATQNEGLRYTPRPLVPYLNLNTGVRTTFTRYSSGDSQNSLLADIALEAQLGHLARNFGDYTRLLLGYSQSFIGEATSPFLFDREVDRNVVSLGIAQQLYGPIIAGFETAFSVSSGETVNTIYSLEYSRRTYGILLRYNATQEAGSIGLRLSNFNWVGGTDPFDTPQIRQVEAGVVDGF